LRRTISSKGHWGLGLTIAGLALYSYHVRELLSSLALFTVAYLFLTLAALGMVLAWWASEQVADWSGPASRKLIAVSRRVIAAYAKP
jgi:hypothetical protein